MSRTVGLKAGDKKIGFNRFVSVGSMLDVDFGDMIVFLGGP
jgi:acyl-CoA synthetase (NDP forming)